MLKLLGAETFVDNYPQVYLIVKTFVVAVNGFINPAVDISILTIIVNSEFLLI